MQELMPAAFGTAVLVDSLLATTVVLAPRRNRTGFKRYAHSHPTIHSNSNSVRL